MRLPRDGGGRGASANLKPACGICCTAGRFGRRGQHRQHGGRLVQFTGREGWFRTGAGGLEPHGRDDAGQSGRLGKRQGLDLNRSGEAPEIRAVERQQATNVMHEHGGNEVGVVHLLACARISREKPKQLLQYRRSFFGDFER
jgi:hypothetical protein